MRELMATGATPDDRQNTKAVLASTDGLVSLPGWVVDEAFGDYSQALTDEVVAQDTAGEDVDYGDTEAEREREEPA